MTSSRGSAAVDVPLKLRPTGRGFGIDKDRPDYTVVIGEWEVGRIYETRVLYPWTGCVEGKPFLTHGSFLFSTTRGCLFRGRRLVD
jgi:hypothetical protein